MTTTCRKCQSAIRFQRLPSGKLAPVNADGSEHWTACNTARTANAMQGRFFHTEAADYYERDGKRFYVRRSYVGRERKRKSTYSGTDRAPWDFDYFMECYE